MEVAVPETWLRARSSGDACSRGRAWGSRRGGAAARGRALRPHACTSMAVGVRLPASGFGRPRREATPAREPKCSPLSGKGRGAGGRAWVPRTGLAAGGREDRPPRPGPPAAAPTVPEGGGLRDGGSCQVKGSTWSDRSRPVGLSLTCLQTGGVQRSEAETEMLGSCLKIFWQF